MSGTGLIRQLFARYARGARPGREGRSARPAPRVERLEDRCLFSVEVLAAFNGMNYRQSGQAEPPDTTLAVGPEHVVEMVNSAIAIYDKATGAELQRMRTVAFFNDFPIQFDFDPVVIYDDIDNRFVVGVLDRDTTTRQGFFTFAVSDTSNPLDGFSERHHLDITLTLGGGPTWGDYPKLGYNAEAYFVTTNQFSFPTPGFIRGTQVRTIEKASVLDADPSTLTTYGVSRPTAFTTMAAASMHNALPGDPMYFVSTPGGNNIRVTRMTDFLSDTPTFVDMLVPVPAYSTTVPRATQQGGTPLINTGDARMQSAAWRRVTDEKGTVLQERLVSAHNVGLSGLARARWYEFDTNAETPFLVQSGQVDPGPGVHTYYPSIQVNAAGDLGMTYMQSSAGEFMSMYVTGQSVFEFGTGQMQAGVVTHPGTARYTGTRAGDYSGIGVDPVDDTFWAGNEYRGANFWDTGIAQFYVTFDGNGGGPLPSLDFLLARPAPAALGDAGSGSVGTIRREMPVPAGWAPSPANERAAVSTLRGSDGARREPRSPERGRDVPRPLLDGWE